MMAKVEAKMDLRNVQEQVEDGTKAVGTYSRKAERIYLGILGMAYDYSREMMKTGVDFLDKAEKRGIKVEQMLNERASAMRKEATEEVRGLRERVEKVGKEVAERGEAVEKEVQKAMEKVKPSSVNGKRGEVDQIKIEVEVVTQPPIVGYDEMNVEEVSERLGLLDMEKLLEVRSYEAAHKNRVTVLREIDNELEARAEAATTAV